MLEFVFSPHWFFGKDILIDIISVLVLALISYVTFQYYRFDKQRKGHLLFSSASALLSLSFIFKIVTNFTLYYRALETKQVGSLLFTYEVVRASYFPFLLGTLLYRALTLLGLYVLFTLYYREEKKYNLFFMSYFIFLIVFLSVANPFVFHLTALVFLGCILYYLLNNCKKYEDVPARVLFLSFFFIALSQLVFIFMMFGKSFYVVAEFIQLIGYCLLLLSFLLVRYYGKKKIKK